MKGEELNPLQCVHKRKVMQYPCLNRKACCERVNRVLTVAWRLRGFAKAAH